ncbi:hypothetical protein JCM10212_000847 [Sporobolomyces blumeae]
MSDLRSVLRGFYPSRQGKVTVLDFRSIGTICTALERGDVKKALVECQSLLKRKPHDPSALAIKAVAVSISSKPLTASSRQELNKAVSTIKSVRDGAALDDGELVMAIYFALNVAGQNAEALELLLQAAERNPDDESLSQEAFVQSIFWRNFEKAQKLSMRMASKFQDNTEYTFWSIMSIVLLVRDLKHPETDVLLSIAERQLSSYFSDPSTSQAYKTPDEFQTASRVLELRVQYASASPDARSLSKGPPTCPSLSPSDPPRTPRRALLDHFHSPEGDKWCDQNLGFELWRREVELAHGDVDDWKLSIARLKLQLEAGDINWHTMLYLIRCSFAVAARSPAATAPAEDATQPPSDALQTVSAARDLFRDLSTTSPKAKVERGFPLALLEIARELRCRGWPQDDSFEDLLISYFDRFSTKMCCFDDLLPYLDALEPDESSSVRSKMETIGEKREDSASLGESPASARRSINALKIARYLSREENVGSELAKADDFAARYFAALPLGQDLPPTELQPADDFALLAGQALVSAYHMSRDRAHLERAAALLDHALRKSRYKYQIRIVLINILRLLGAPSLSLAHYRTFGVKNVQYDTLSHLVVHRAATFALEASKDAGVFDEMQRTIQWYGLGSTEASQMSTQPFTYPNYTKVEDFNDFRERLNDSLGRSLAILEIVRMRLLRGLLDTPATEWSCKELRAVADRPERTYHDNRDFKTLPHFQRRESPQIWAQTALGGLIDAQWLRAMWSVYSCFLQPSTAFVVPEQETSTLTRPEASLFRFSSLAQRALVASLEDANEAEQAALAALKEHGELVTQIIDDAASLPCDILHVASIALEAFSLLELGIEQRLDEMAEQKSPDQAKHSKRFRNLRNSARHLVLQMSQRVMAHSKKASKDRNKVVAALSPLTQHEPLTQDVLTNFAVALVDSRKASIEGLATTMHRRTAK